MIDRLYRNIASGLKKVRPYTIYLEDVPQNMKMPSFLISIYDQNPSNGINGRKKNDVGIDVMYYPENAEEAEAKQECWKIGEEMNLHFQITDFKISNRNVEIVDDVLHYTFNVRYRSIPVDDSNKMQEMTKNTELKEE